MIFYHKQILKIVLAYNIAWTYKNQLEIVLEIRKFDVQLNLYYPQAYEVWKIQAILVKIKSIVSMNN